jgi:hypothetical protein
MAFPTADRAPIQRLTDVQTFLQSAEHLKALTLQLQDRRNRTSRLERSLERQVQEFTTVCKDLASKSPRVAALWRDVLAELDELCNPTSEPNKGE